mgnify:CR=1 FL=1
MLIYVGVMGSAIFIGVAMTTIFNSSLAGWLGFLGALALAGMLMTDGR